MLQILEDGEPDKNRGIHIIVLNQASVSTLSKAYQVAGPSITTTSKHL